SGNLEQAETYIGGRYLGTGEPSAFVWALSDELGTVRVRTNSSGAAVETDTSWPFGAYLNQVGTNSNLHFTGKYRDGETGFDYFGARYYASTLGRFLAPDWSATPEATPYADLSNPQSLNLYGYVLNNPATAADPDGHCWFGFISIGASCGKTKSAPVLEGGTAATGEATLDGSFDVSGILDSLKAGADAVTELGASALTSATVFFALTEDAGNPMEAQILRRGREQAASASARPAPKQTAQDMAAQIQRDLGRKARREFHDAKDTAGRDRTLGELNEDAERIYKGHGKQPPAWMRPGGGR
ncbi:MAG: RHS repeat-associated core domain-containing protein, partial [Terriglobales bacterium]